MRTRRRAREAAVSLLIPAACAFLLLVSGCEKNPSPSPAQAPAAPPTAAATSAPTVGEASPPSPAGAHADEERALHEEQRREADRLLGLFPESDDALYLVGLVHNEQGDWKTATACWEKALALDPARADTCNNLGYAFFLREDFDKAEALFRKAIAIDPAFVEPYEHLGMILVKHGRPRDAIAVLEAAQPPSAPVERYLGQAYQHLQDYDKARQHYEAALRLKPGYREVHYGLATICARLGEEAKAQEHRAEFSALEGEAQAHSRRARSAYDPLVIARRSAAKTHADVGRVLRAFGKTDDAERLWLRAASLDPENVASRAQLAALYEQTKREPQALAAYAELARIEPANGLHCFNLGNLHLRLGQVDAAEAAFRQVIARAPERSEGYAALAQVRARADDAQGALAAIDRALAIEPANSDYQRFREALSARK